MAIPFNIRLGPSAPSQEVRNLVDMDGGPPRIEETGTFESVTAGFRLRDKALAYTAMRGEWHLQIEWRATGETLFRGLVRTPTREVVTTEHGLDIAADDMAVLLDRCIITKRGLERPAGEGVKARIAWLFGEMTHDAGSVFGGTRVAQPLLIAGFNYTTHVAALSTNLPKQRFPANLTLRQALERILGAASDSANYYVEWPFLHVFDDANPESGRTAPYNVRVAHTLTSAQVAPEEMLVDWDTSRLINGYYIRGKNAAGSGFFTDQDLLAGPWSVNLFGPRFAYLDGPDSDTQAKAQRLARAALRDTRNPIPRISFTLTGEAKAVNGSNRWKGGQLLYINSSEHGLAGTGTDAGPWAGTIPLQPFRVARVTTELLSGDGERRVTIEAGGRRRNLYAGVP
jgi:hypothetical protein